MQLQAIEFKRSISLDMLRSVWDVLEDPMYHWFAVSLGYSTNQKVLIDRFVEIDYPHAPSSDDDQHPPPPPKIKARFIWDPPSSLRSSHASYFSSLSDYFSFLSAPSLPSLATPSHWYPSYWRRDAEEQTGGVTCDDESDDDTTAYPFSPTSFSPTSASFYSPPHTPATTGPTLPPPSVHPSSASSPPFHVFSPSSYRSLFPTLWKKDEEDREHAQPAAVVGEEEESGGHDDEQDDEERQRHAAGGGGEKNERKSKSSEKAEEGGEAKADHDGPCLVFHVHGGGFVSQSSQSHVSYLKQWAGLTGIPILTVDYRCVHTLKVPGLR
jgi:hypothetical protein